MVRIISHLELDELLNNATTLYHFTSLPVWIKDFAKIFTLLTCFPEKANWIKNLEYYGVFPVTILQPLLLFIENVSRVLIG